MNVNCDACMNNKKCGLYQNILKGGKTFPPACTKHKEEDTQQDMFDPAYEIIADKLAQEQVLKESMSYVP